MPLHRVADIAFLGPGLRRDDLKYSLSYTTALRHHDRPRLAQCELRAFLHPGRVAKRLNTRNFETFGNFA